MEKKINVIQTLLAICCSIGVYLATYLLILSVAGSIPAVREVQIMYLNAAAMAGAAVLLSFTIKKEEYQWKKRGRTGQNIAAVILLAYATSAFFNFILGSIPWQEVAGADMTPDENVYYGIPLWARMICYELVAPVAEELLFRQVIFGRLKKILPVWGAVLISALAFGIYHGNLVQGIYACIMGIFLALVYEWTGNFLYPVLFHMIANHLSDICYEFEKLSKIVYSLCGCVIAALVIGAVIWYFIKKQNKCSEKH